jgi:uncharacterized protein
MSFRRHDHMPLNLLLVVHTVLEDYTLPWNGPHGVAHWARVFENGLRLAEESRAIIEVVQLFAVLHDCRRRNEHYDPDHGPRAALLARALLGEVFELPKDQFRLLHRACADHTHERTHRDVTIQTCWDADRLDLGRVGMMPEVEYLSTEVAKRPETIRWADERATLGFIPEFVQTEWGIELEAHAE